MNKRNPQNRPDEYEFVKERATLLKDIGMMASRNARVSSKGDSVLGVDVEWRHRYPTERRTGGCGPQHYILKKSAGTPLWFFLGNDLRNRFSAVTYWSASSSRSRAILMKWWRGESVGQRLRKLAGEFRDDSDRELVPESHETAAKCCVPHQSARSRPQLQLAEAEMKCALFRSEPAPAAGTGP